MASLLDNLFARANEYMAQQPTAEEAYPPVDAGDVFRGVGGGAIELTNILAGAVANRLAPQSEFAQNIQGYQDYMAQNRANTPGFDIGADVGGFADPTSLIDPTHVMGKLFTQMAPAFIVPAMRGLRRETLSKARGGVFSGLNDQIPRLEFPDEDLMFKFNMYDELRPFMSTGEYPSQPITSVLRHRLLDEVDPEILRNVNIQLNPNYKPGQASFAEIKGVPTIRIAESHFEEGTGRIIDPQQLRQDIMHELQHNIQSLYGLPGGGAPPNMSISELKQVVNQTSNQMAKKRWQRIVGKWDDFINGDGPPLRPPELGEIRRLQTKAYRNLIGEDEAYYVGRKAGGYSDNMIKSMTSKMDTPIARYSTPNRNMLEEQQEGLREILGQLFER